MSGYPDIEALWLERMRAISGYDTNNTSRGNWGIVNNGKSDRYVVLKPGTHSRTMNSIGGGRLETYRTILEVHQKYRDDGTTLTTLETAVNTLIDSLDTYPRLGETGNSVQKGEIVEVREVLGYPDPQAPSWLVCELVGETSEEKTITFQD